MKILFCAIALLSGTFTAWSNDDLIQAAREGDLEVISKFAGKKADFNSKGDLGLTPWQVAIIARRIEAADLLAKLGADTTLPFPTPEDSLEAYLKKAIPAGGPGTAVLVSQNGKILFEKGYGLAVMDTKTPVTKQTKFRIGSITKQMTSSAILKLVEAGKLTLETKLSKFYPDYSRADEVTIHHLLTHTSGIPSYTGKPTFLGAVLKPTTPGEILKTVRDDPYDFDPGAKYSYCNTGYLLLGEIAGKLHEKAFLEMMQEAIFRPAGMKNSGVYREGLGLAYDSYGYSFEDGQSKPALKWDMTWADGAGAVYATVGDLYLWNEAIFTSDFLQPETLTKALTPASTKEDPDPKTGYGYGWVSEKVNGLSKVSHGGGLHGWSSYLTHFPDQKVTIAVLSNSLPGVPGTEPYKIAKVASHFYLWKKMAANNQPKIDPNVNPSDYAAYEGRFNYGAFIVVIQAREQRLFAQLIGQDEMEIFPKEGSTFFWKAVEAEMTFEKDEAGKVVGSIHRQNGRVLHSKKLEKMTYVKLTTEQLDLIIGKYEMQPGAVFTITREDDQLFAALSGQPKLPIYPSSELTFHWEAVVAKVVFEKDKEGKITGGAFTQNGAKQPLKKIE